MTHLRYAIVVLLALALGGCAVAAGVFTAFGAVSSAISVGQRNEAQDTAEQNLEELRGLRADLRRSGLVRPEPLPVSEAARDQQAALADQPLRRSLWERVKRMVP